VALAFATLADIPTSAPQYYFEWLFMTRTAVAISGGFDEKIVKYFSK
jgi:hypothetical protein